MNDAIPRLKWLEDVTSAPHARPRMSGHQVSIWIPTLNGFPTAQVRLAPVDPLSDPGAFSNKVLEVLRREKRAFSRDDILSALQTEGLAKEPKAVRKLLTDALQRLQRRGLAQAVGRIWIATSHAKGGIAMQT